MKSKKHCFFFISFLLWLGMGLIVSVEAGPKDFVIYVTRLGGDSDSAKPFITRFTSFIEDSLAWTQGRMKGYFFTDRSEVMTFIDSSKPGIGVLEPTLYFELAKTKQLTAIAQLESKDLVSSRLHLVVKNPDWQSLSDLKGKKLWTTLAESPDYLSKVVFKNSIGAKDHFQIKKIGQALKGVRAVLRGEADATLLDDLQFAKAKTMTGGNALRSVFTSPPLPALLVVVFGKSLTSKEQKALIALLLKMCGTPKGGAICQEMLINRFAPIQSQLLQETQQRYDK